MSWFLITVSIACNEFSEEIQKIDINLIIKNNTIYLDNTKPLKNEVFPFLTFDTNFESALKFVSDFINKILIPENQLKGSVHIH